MLYVNSFFIIFPIYYTISVSSLKALYEINKNRSRFTEANRLIKTILYVFLATQALYVFYQLEQLYQLKYVVPYSTGQDEYAIAQPLLRKKITFFTRITNALIAAIYGIAFAQLFNKNSSMTLDRIFKDNESKIRVIFGFVIIQGGIFFISALSNYNQDY